MSGLSVQPVVHGSKQWKDPFDVDELVDLPLSAVPTGCGEAKCQPAPDSASSLIGCGGMGSGMVWYGMYIYIYIYNI